ncbi:MAG: hypothetical protein IJS30_02245 [Bacteroidales bacterium]|nr:hypothetical protein [Bacteroidales bacterium]
MKHLRWFCIISIFLFAAFTTSAQSALEAVEYERVLYEGAAPAEANAALLSRAASLVGLQRYDDAADALDRLRLYALSDEDRLRCNHLRAVTLFRTGNYCGAVSCLDEGFPEGKEAWCDAVLILSGAGRFSQARQLAVNILPEREAQLNDLFSKAPRFKKEGTTLALSFLPPLGHLYLKEKNWLPVTLISYGGMALTAWQIVEGNYLNAFLGGGLLLNASYMEHNIATFKERTDAANEKLMREFLTTLESGLKQP